MPLRPCPIHLLFNSEEGYGCQVCLNAQFLSHCDDEPVELEWVYRHEEGMPYSICCEAKFRCGENTHTRAGTCTNTCHPPEGDPGEDDDDDDDGPEDPKNVCGPEIGTLLRLSLSRFETIFNSWGFLFRRGQCVRGWLNWDFPKLHKSAIRAEECNQGNCCEDTVQVGTGCYPQWAVNYALFGAAWAKCRYPRQYMMDPVLWYNLGLYGYEEFVLKLRSKHGVCPHLFLDIYNTKLGWAEAGYEFVKTGNLPLPIMLPETARCGICRTPYSHTGPLDITFGAYSD